MLDVKKASELIRNSFPERSIDRCYEYPKYFVFSTINKEGEQILNGSFVVDKLTSTIRAFNPMDIPASELNCGKEVTL